MKSPTYPIGTSVRVITGAREGLQGIVTLSHDGPKYTLVEIDGMIHKISTESLQPEDS